MPNTNCATKIQKTDKGTDLPASSRRDSSPGLEPITRVTSVSSHNTDQSPIADYKSQLASGIIPLEVRETMRLAPLDTPSTIALQAALNPLIDKIQATPSWQDFLLKLDPDLRDFTPQPHRVAISDIDAKNAFEFTYSSPALVGFTRSMLQQSTPQQFIYVLMHEMVHGAIDRLIGSGRAVSKLEEGAAYAVPLAVMRDLGINPEGIERFVRSLAGHSYKVSLLSMDPHPAPINTIAIVETTLTALGLARGSLSTSSQVSPSVSLDELEPQKYVPPNSEHISSLDEVRAKVPCWQSATIDEKLAALTAYVRDVEPLWRVRQVDLMKELQLLKASVTTDAAKEALHSFGDAILSRIEREPEAWTLIYREARDILPPGGPRELGRLRGLVDGIAAVIDASREGHTDKLRISVLELLRIVAEEPLVQTEKGRKFLTFFVNQRFPFPERPAKDPPAWNALVALSKDDPKALEVAILLGLGTDPRIGSMCLAKLAKEVTTSNPHVNAVVQEMITFPSVGLIAEPRSRENRLSECIVEGNRLKIKPQTSKAERKAMVAGAMRTAIDRILSSVDATNSKSVDTAASVVSKLNKTLASRGEYGGSAKAPFGILMVDQLLKYPEVVARLNGDGVLEQNSAQQDLTNRIPALLAAEPDGALKLNRFLGKLLGARAWQCPLWGIPAPSKPSALGAIVLDPQQTWVSESTQARALCNVVESILELYDDSPTSLSQVRSSLNTLRDFNSPLVNELLGECGSWREWNTRVARRDELITKVQSLGLKERQAKDLVEGSLVWLVTDVRQLPSADVIEAAEIYLNLSRIGGTWSQRLTDNVGQREELGRDVLRPYLDDLPNELESKDPTEAARLLATFDAARLLSEKDFLKLVNRVISRATKSSDPKVAESVAVELFDTSAIGQPEIRDTLLKMWASAVARQVGKETDREPNNPAYRDAVMMHVAAFRDNAGYGYLRTALALLAETIEAQDLVCDSFKRATPRLTERDSLNICLGGIVTEAGFETIRADAGARRAFFDYFRGSGDKRQTEVTLSHLLRSGIAEQSENILLPSSYREDDIMSIRNPEVRPWIVLIDYERGRRPDLTPGARSARASSLRNLDTLHRNFSAAPLEVQAVVLRELMLGTATEEAERVVILRDYVDEAFAGEDAGAKETRVWVHALLSCLKDYERPSYAAALLAAHSGGETSTSIGASLARFAERLSPLAVKIAQGASEHPAIDKDIRSHFTRLTYRVDEVPRWEYVQWIRELEPELIRSFGALAGGDLPEDLRIVQIGELLGSGSVNATVNVQLSDGRWYALSMIRPYSLERTERDAGIFSEALDKKGTTGRATSTLKELLDGANRRMKLEVNGKLAIDQGGVFRDLYVGSHVGMPDTTVHFDAPRVLAAGENFYLMDLVGGEHLAELSKDPTAEERMHDISVATLAVFMADLFEGKFCADRHVGNRKVVGETIYELDPKGLSLEPWSVEGYEQLTSILVGIMQSGRVTDLDSFLEVFLECEDAIRQEGGVIDPLIPEVKKALLSLSPYFNRVSFEELQRVLYSALWNPTCDECRIGVFRMLTSKLEEVRVFVEPLLKANSIDFEGVVGDLKKLFEISSSVADALQQSGILPILGIEIPEPSIKVVRGRGSRIST